MKLDFTPSLFFMSLIKFKIFTGYNGTNPQHENTPWMIYIIYNIIVT